MTTDHKIAPLRVINWNCTIIFVKWEMGHFFFNRKTDFHWYIKRPKANTVNRGIRLPTHQARNFFDLIASYKYQILQKQIYEPFFNKKAQQQRKDDWFSYQAIKSSIISENLTNILEKTTLKHWKIKTENTKSHIWRGGRRHSQRWCV
jgi:hypothetical protein